MSCFPCKDVECEEIVDEEYESLMDLYRRLFEPRDECSADWEWPETAAGATEAVEAAAAAAADHGCDAADESLIKRADRQLTDALLRQSRPADDGGQEGDVKHLTARLPAFKSCKSRKAGAVNAALLGLNLEDRMAGAGTATAGDGRHDAKRAAYDLAVAEAHCKHAGAVEAAELAVRVEPAANLAEVAARFGAQSYAGTGGAADGRGGRESGDDSLVVVVAYVGNTGPCVPPPSSTAQQPDCD